MIRVGTSGWSYPEWIGPFYPPGTPASRMLQYYGERFGTVEAHSTHRRTPTPAGLARWAAQVPSDFRFALKAHANITHRRDLDGLAERMATFVRAVAPLERRRGPVLFVLPHRQPDLVRLDALLGALAEWPEVSPVFELGAAWRVDEVLDRLRAASASLALVDRDDARPAQVPTELLGRLTYVRLRRSSYADEELAAWAERLAGIEGDVYVFLKHDQRGDAPRYARTLVEYLDRG